MLARALAEVPFTEDDRLVDSFRPSEDDEMLLGFELGFCPFMLTKGCTGFSWPGEGPVDRMKSAKSRIDSDSIFGSLASGLVTTLRLGDGLWWVPLDDFALGAVVLGKFAVP